MSKILCLNIVHLNTRYQRTMESNEKMFCNFLPEPWSGWCGPHNTDVTFQYVT